MLHGDLIVYWMSRLASYHPHLSPSAEPNLLNAFDWLTSFEDTVRRSVVVVANTSHHPFKKLREVVLTLNNYKTFHLKIKEKTAW